MQELEAGHQSVFPPNSNARMAPMQFNRPLTFGACGMKTQFFTHLHTFFDLQTGRFGPHSCMTVGPGMTVQQSDFKSGICPTVLNHLEETSQGRCWHNNMNMYEPYAVGSDFWREDTVGQPMS